MQTMSLLITVLIVEASVFHYHDFGTALVALPIGMVGGYFAPISREILAVIQNLRKP